VLTWMRCSDDDLRYPVMHGLKSGYDVAIARLIWRPQPALVTTGVHVLTFLLLPMALLGGAIRLPGLTR